MRRRLRRELRRQINDELARMDQQIGSRLDAWDRRAPMTADEQAEVVVAVRVVVSPR